MTVDPTPRRVAALLEQLPQGAAAISCDPANVRWISGLAGEPHVLYGMAPLWVVVGPEGAWRVVAPAGELAWIEEQAGLEQVIAHGRFVLRGSPGPALGHRLVGHDGVGDAIVVALAAVEAGAAVVLDDRTPARLARELERSLAPRSCELASRPWQRARAVKDPAEIAALRRVNEIAETAIRLALRGADEDISERQLLTWIRGRMLEAGARPMLGSVGFGERGALVDFPTSDRVLRAGEAIRIDVGCLLDGYHADLARTAVLGDPPDWLVEAHDALVAGELAALTALRPEATGAELFDAAVQAARASGLPDYERTHCGHGIGLDMYEPPSIAPGSTDVLVPGMTCCVETPLYEIGRAGVQIEDAVVVTGTGYERLGSLPQELLAAGS